MMEMPGWKRPNREEAKEKLARPFMLRFRVHNLEFYFVEFFVLFLPFAGFVGGMFLSGVCLPAAGRVFLEWLCWDLLWYTK